MALLKIILCLDIILNIFSYVLLNSENIIIPRYTIFKSSMDNLKNSIDTFKSTPSSDNFDLLQNNWIDAYKKWQYVEMFNISKAEEIMYNLKMNTYPVSKERIDNNIDTEKTDLSIKSIKSLRDYQLGVVFIDKVKDSKTLCTLKEFAEFHEDRFRNTVKQIVEHYGS